MRQKYIRLIKDFIVKKPQYKYTLDEIKRDTEIVGATEEELEEAIRQIEESPEDIMDSESRTGIIKKKIKDNPRAYKSTVAVFSMLLIIPVAVFIIGSFFSEGPGKSSTSTVASSDSIVEKIKRESIPVVYANSTPIDASAVFSINPNNVKLTITGKPKKEVLGFFPYWMIDNWDKVNIGALTSISLFGLESNGKGEIITKREEGAVDPGWAMWQNPNLNSLIRKARNNDLKVYLTVKSFNNDNIESLSLSDEAQRNFIANVSYLVSSKNLDGVNIDFEPTRGMSEATRDGFTRLINNLSIELKKQNPKANITVDTYLSSGSEPGLFNLPLLAKTIDAFVIMGYDMHTPKGSPGPVASMGGGANVIGYVQNYLEKVPEDKIILAVPYYGYDWPINSGEAPSKAVPYAQIANATRNSNLIWNEAFQTPSYGYKEGGVERIVHFDNVRSLGIKYDFINKKNLKGVGIWALGYDGNYTDLEKLLADKFIYN